MNDLPTVVLLGASEPRQAATASLLQQVAVVRVGATVLAAASLGPRLVLVDLAVHDIEGALRTIEDVGATMPNVQLVALAASKDPDLILRAMRAGAREFAVLGPGSELPQIVQRLSQHAQDQRATGKIISVFPAKGGAGGTTVATNLAGALQRGGKRVVVVDFDQQLGGVLVFLDMAESYTIADVVKNLYRFDRDLLYSSLARHASGLYVLARPHTLEDVEALTAQQIASLLQLLSRHFDYVVCDGLRGITELSVAVLDASHEIEVLLLQDVPSLKNAKHCLEVFDRLGYEHGKVQLTVNRYHKGVTIDLGAIAENLGRHVSCTLANDYRAASAAVNRGVLLGEAAPRSKLNQDIEQLANRIAGVTTERRPSFFGSLFGRGPKAEAEGTSGNDKRGYHEARRTPEST
jgi:pilus assembly protein CpaE